MKVIVAIRHATNNGTRPRVAALCSRAVLLGAALVCGAVITLLVAGGRLHRLTGVGVLIMSEKGSAKFVQQTSLEVIYDV